MNLDVEETGALERRLKVEVPTADVDRAFDAFYRGLSKTANLKGFRKGRIPRAVLERHYAPQARGEVLQSLVRDTLFEAIERAGLDIVSEPRLDPDDAPTQGESFRYGATVEVRPEIELSQVEGLKLAAVELPEPEGDPVEAHLQELRERQAALSEEAEDVAAAGGHVAVVDFEGTIGGEPFEGGSGTEASFEIGSGRAPEAFEAGLVGMRAGESRTFEVEFPRDEVYERSGVAGRTAEFHVLLRGLKRKDLPELDDELAKDVSEFDTLDELRADLARRVAESREAELRRLRRQRAVEALVAANPFPLPRSLVDAEVEARIARLLQGLGDRFSEDERAALVERWRGDFRAPVERDTALSLLAPRIAESREIRVSDEEVDGEIDGIAEREGHPAKELRRAYRERDGIERLRAAMLQEKVIEYLLSEAAPEDA